MLLYHVTTLAKGTSIRRSGIDPKYATGKLPAVWFVREPKIEWALLHVQKRSGLPLSQLIIFQVELPETEVTRRWRNVYTTGRVIRPRELLREYKASELIGSDPCDVEGDEET